MRDRRCTDRSGRELVGLYVLGRLGPAEEQRARRHVDVCPACSADFVDLSGVTAVLDLLSPVDVAEILAESAVSPPR